MRTPTHLLVSHLPAAEVARLAHFGHFRRDGRTPYIMHPWDVAVRVHRATDGNRAAVSVAWLHDVLEDGPKAHAFTPAALAVEFRQDVVDAVVALTKRPGESYDAYLDRVAANELARLVKVHDIVSNLADDPTPAQVKKYALALRELTS